MDYSTEVVGGAGNDVYIDKHCRNMNQQENEAEIERRAECR